MEATEIESDREWLLLVDKKKGVTEKRKTIDARTVHLVNNLK